MKLHLPVKLRASLIAAVIAVSASVYNAKATDYVAPSADYGWNTNDISLTERYTHTAGNNYTATSTDYVNYDTYDDYPNVRVGYAVEGGNIVQLDYDGTHYTYNDQAKDAAVYSTTPEGGDTVYVGKENDHEYVLSADRSAFEEKMVDGQPVVVPKVTDMARVLIETTDLTNGSMISFLQGDTTITTIGTLEINNSVRSGVEDLQEGDLPYQGNLNIVTNAIDINKDSQDQGSTVVLEDVRISDYSEGNDATPISTDIDEDSRLVILDGTTETLGDQEKTLLGLTGIESSVEVTEQKTVDLGNVTGKGSLTVLGNKERTDSVRGEVAEDAPEGAVGKLTPGYNNGAVDKDDLVTVTIDSIGNTDGTTEFGEVNIANADVAITNGIDKATTVTLVNSVTTAENGGVSARGFDVNHESVLTANNDITNMANPGSGHVDISGKIESTEGSIALSNDQKEEGFGVHEGATLIAQNKITLSNVDATKTEEIHAKTGDLYLTANSSLTNAHNVNVGNDLIVEAKSDVQDSTINVMGNVVVTDASTGTTPTDPGTSTISGSSVTVTPKGNSTSNVEISGGSSMTNSFIMGANGDITIGGKHTDTDTGEATGTVVGISADSQGAVDFISKDGDMKGNLSAILDLAKDTDKTRLTEAGINDTGKTVGNMIGNTAGNVTITEGAEVSSTVITAGGAISIGDMDATAGAEKGTRVSGVIIDARGNLGTGDKDSGLDYSAGGTDNSLSVGDSSVSSSIILGITGDIRVKDSVLNNDYIDGGVGVDIEGSGIIDTDIVNLQADIKIAGEANISSSDPTKPWTMNTKGTYGEQDEDSYTGGSIILNNTTLENGVIKSGVEAVRQADGSYDYSPITSETPAQQWNAGSSALEDIPGVNLPYGEISVTNSTLKGMEVTTVAGDITLQGTDIPMEATAAHAASGNARTDLAAIKTSLSKLAGKPTTFDTLRTLTINERASDAQGGEVWLRIFKVVDGAEVEVVTSSNSQTFGTNNALRTFEFGPDGVKLNPDEDYRLRFFNAATGGIETSVGFATTANGDDYALLDESGFSAVVSAEITPPLDNPPAGLNIILGSTITTGNGALNAERTYMDSRTEGEGEEAEYVKNTITATKSSVIDESYVNGTNITIQDADEDATAAPELTINNTILRGDTKLNVESTVTISKGSDVALDGYRHSNAEKDAGITAHKLYLDELKNDTATLANSKIAIADDGSTMLRDTPTDGGTVHANTLNLSNTEGTVGKLLDMLHTYDEGVYGSATVNINGGSDITAQGISSSHANEYLSDKTKNYSYFGNINVEGNSRFTIKGEAIIRNYRENVDAGEAPNAYKFAGADNTTGSTVVFEQDAWLTDAHIIGMDAKPTGNFGVAATENLTSTSINGAAHIGTLRLDREGVLNLVSTATGDTPKPTSYIANIKPGFDNEAYIGDEKGASHGTINVVNETLVTPVLNSNYLSLGLNGGTVVLKQVSAADGATVASENAANAHVVLREITNGVIAGTPAVDKTPVGVSTIKTTLTAVDQLTTTEKTDGIASLTVAPDPNDPNAKGGDFDADNVTIRAYQVGTTNSDTGATEAVANTGFITIEGDLTGENNTLEADKNISIRGILAEVPNDQTEGETTVLPDTSNTIISHAGNIAIGEKGIQASDNTLTAQENVNVLGAITGNENKLTADSGIYVLGAITGNENKLTAQTTTVDGTIVAGYIAAMGNLEGDRNVLNATGAIITGLITGGNNDLDAGANIITGLITGGNNDLDAGTTIMATGIEGNTNTLDAQDSITVTGLITGNENVLTADTIVATGIEGNTNTLDAQDTITVTGTITGNENILTADTIDVQGTIDGNNNELTANTNVTIKEAVTGADNVIHVVNGSLSIEGDILGENAEDTNALTAGKTVSIKGTLGGAGTQVLAYGNGLSLNDVAITVGEFAAQGTNLNIATTSDPVFGTTNGNGSIVIGAMGAAVDENGNAVVSIDKTLANNIVSNNSYVFIGALNGSNAVTKVTAAKDIIIGDPTLHAENGDAPAPDTASNLTLCGANIVLNRPNGLELTDSVITTPGSITGTSLTLTTSGDTRFTSTAANVTLTELEIAGYAVLNASGAVNLQNLTIDGRNATLISSDVWVSDTLTLRNGAVFDTARLTAGSIVISDSTLTTSGTLSLNGTLHAAIGTEEGDLKSGSNINVQGPLSVGELKADSQSVISALSIATTKNAIEGGETTSGDIIADGGTIKAAAGDVQAAGAITVDKGGTIKGTNVSAAGAITVGSKEGDTVTGGSLTADGGTISGTSLEAHLASISATQGISLDGALTASDRTEITGSVTQVTNVTVEGDSYISGSISGMSGALALDKGRVGGSVTGATSATLTNGSSVGALSMSGADAHITATNSDINGAIAGAENVTLNGSDVQGTIGMSGVLQAKTGATITGKVTGATSATIEGNSTAGDLAMDETSGGSVTITGASVVGNITNATSATITDSSTGSLDMMGTEADITATNATIGGAITGAKNVKLTDATAQDITLTGKLTASRGGRVGNISGANGVDLTNVTTGDITGLTGALTATDATIGNLTQAEGTKLSSVTLVGTTINNTADITSSGVVSLENSTVGGGLVTDGSATISDSTVNGAITTAYDLTTNGNVVANGKVTVGEDLTVNDGTLDAGKNDVTVTGRITLNNGRVEAGAVTSNGSTFTDVEGSIGSLDSGTEDMIFSGTNLTIEGALKSADLTLNRGTEGGAEITVTGATVANGKATVTEDSTLTGTTLTASEGLEVSDGGTVTMSESIDLNNAGLTVTEGTVDAPRVTQAGTVSATDGATINGDVSGATGVTVEDSDINGSVGMNGALSVTNGSVGHVTGATSATIEGNSTADELTMDETTGGSVAITGDSTVGNISNATSATITGDETGATTGSISMMGDDADITAENATIGGAITGANDVTLTDATAQDITLTGKLTASDGTVGAISGANGVDLTNVTTGDITNLTGDLTATDATIGNLTQAEGTKLSSVTLVGTTINNTADITSSGVVSLENSTVGGGLVTDGSATISDSTVNGAITTAYNLTTNGNVVANGKVTVGNNLEVNDGTLDAGKNDVTVTGSITLNNGRVEAGAVTSNGSTFTDVEGSIGSLDSGTEDMIFSGSNLTIEGALKSADLTLNRGTEGGAEITVTGATVANGKATVTEDSTLTGTTLTASEGLEVTDGGTVTMSESIDLNNAGLTVTEGTVDAPRVTQAGTVSATDGATINGDVSGATGVTVEDSDINGSVGMNGALSVTNGSVGNVTGATSATITDSSTGSISMMGDDSDLTATDATIGGAITGANDVTLTDSEVNGAITTTYDLTTNGDVVVEGKVTVGKDLTVNKGSLDAGENEVAVTGSITLNKGRVEAGATTASGKATVTDSSTLTGTKLTASKGLEVSDGGKVKMTESVDLDNAGLTVTNGTVNAPKVTQAGAVHATDGATINSDVSGATGVTVEDSDINGSVGMNGALSVTDGSVGNVTGATSATISGSSTGSVGMTGDNADLTATNSIIGGDITGADDVTLDNTSAKNVTAQGTTTIEGTVSATSVDTEGLAISTRSALNAKDDVAANGLVKIDGSLKSDGSAVLTGTEGSAVTGTVAAAKDVTLGGTLSATGTDIRGANVNVKGTVTTGKSTLTGENIAVDGTLHAGKGTVLDGTVSGTGTINKTGGDTLTLGGDTDMAGGKVNIGDASTVEAADGAHLGTVTVGKGSTLELAGKNDTGTVKADGVKLAKGAILNADIELGKGSDKVSGAVDMGGNSLKLNSISAASEKNIADGTVVKVFDGRVTNVNEDIVHNLDTLNAHMKQSGDVVLSKNYKSAGETENQTQTASALSSINPNTLHADSELSDVFDALNHTRSGEEARAALDSLSGAGLGGIQKAIADEAAEHLQTLRSTLQSLAANVTCKYDANGRIIEGGTSSSISGSVTGGTSQVKGNGNSGKYDRNSIGFMLAGAHAVTDDWTFGGDLSMSFVDATCDATDIDGTAVYADVALLSNGERFHQMGTFGFGLFDFDTERRVNIESKGHTYGGTAKGSTQAMTVNLSYQGIYDLIRSDEGHVLSTVVIGEGTFGQIDAMTEDGMGNAGLRSEFDDVASLTFATGLRYTCEFGAKTNPGYFAAEALFVADAGDTLPKVNNMFIGGGNGFEVAGPEAGNTGVRLNAGALIPLSEQWGIFGNVTSEFRSKQSSVGGSVGLKCSF